MLRIDAPVKRPVNCHLCGGETEARYTATPLGKHAATYHYCADCDHLYVGDPIWLDEAYSGANPHQDTDVAVRNIFTALRLAAFYYFVLGERGHGQYIDVAGGYGLLTRLMRDLGSTAIGRICTQKTFLHTSLTLAMARRRERSAQ